jgi:NOL1/NOP2/sun family putative RNA methylase
VLPAPFIQSLDGIKGFDKKAFEAVHASGEKITSIRLNPAKHANVLEQLFIEANQASRVPWCEQGYYLNERPSFTFDPLFHAGCYYVQEASSMFLEQALKQTTDLSQPLRVLDLCAAPGGKSTHIQSLISKESLLVCNEVIKSRAAVLEENIIKWGALNTVVCNNDPGHFARLENYFDVMVIDAPCSGSGLFRRDPQAINEWSENNVELCCQRQQRIIADAWPALKQDGILIYSTCSYSREEDEEILDWMQENFSVESKILLLNPDWGIEQSVSEKHGMAGYRFYPDKVKGEGFFMAVLQKKDGASFEGYRSKKSVVEKITKGEEALVKPWLEADLDFIYFKQQEEIIGLPASLEADIPLLQTALYIKKAGLRIGKLAAKDLIPDHQLAMSNILNKNIVSIPLNREQSIQYLRRDDVQLNTVHKGWALLNFKGQNLGWVKVLANRFNNYYPKEWRILKQDPNAGGANQ